MQDPETKEMLADLIWLNAVIATELIRIVALPNTMNLKKPRSIWQRSTVPQLCSVSTCSNTSNVIYDTLPTNIVQ
jgi:hypothetical protein